MSPSFSRLAAAVALVGVCLCSSGRASPKAANMPDTPAGKQLAAWLEAYNSGDKQMQRKFIASHYAAAALKKAPSSDGWAGSKWCTTTTAS